jgi:hypothetical protein
MKECRHCDLSPAGEHHERCLFACVEAYVEPDEGATCDHCGALLGPTFYGNPRLRVQYVYCSPAHVLSGPTAEHSRKFRFIEGVLKGFK